MSPTHYCYMQKKPNNLNVSDTLLLHVEEAKQFKPDSKFRYSGRMSTSYTTKDTRRVHV